MTWPLGSHNVAMEDLKHPLGTEAGPEYIGLLAIHREGFTQSWTFIEKTSALPQLAINPKP